MSLSTLIVDTLRDRPGMTQAELRDALLARRNLARSEPSSALGRLVRRGHVFSDGAGDARRYFAVADSGAAGDLQRLALSLVGVSGRTADAIATVLQAPITDVQIALDALVQDRSVERQASSDGVYVYRRAPAPAPKRMTTDEFAVVEKFMALTDAELGLPSLPGAIRLEVIALEDVIRQACEAEAPHAAIRDLAGAQTLLRKAMEALAPTARAA